MAHYLGLTTNKEASIENIRAEYEDLQHRRPHLEACRHSDSSSLTTAAAWQAQVLNPIGKDKTMESPTISVFVSTQAEANAADNASFMSAMSLSTNLFKKFLPGALTIDVPKNFELVEMKILEVQNLANLPTVDWLLEEITNDPQQSILV